MAAILSYFDGHADWKLAAVGGTEGWIGLRHSAQRRVFLHANKKSMH
jgi:hypothetical protein